MSIPEKCQLEDICRVEENPPAELRSAIEAYLAPFAKPTADGKCLKCGDTQGGIFGRFTWGLAHGEGFCGKCKWPGRPIHYIKDSTSGEHLLRFAWILQYHPDFVKTRSVRSKRRKQEQNA